MNRRGIVIPAVLVLFVSPASAAHWSVDYAKSRVGFAVQWSGEPFQAEFKRWNADIEFDPNDLPHSRVSVTIDLASEASDEPDFDSGLKGAQGFETSRFPTAHFDTKTFSPKSPNRYVARGALAIHGVSRDISLPFSLTIAGRIAHVTGTAHLMRTDFGIGQGEWAAPTPVSYDVSVTIDVTAIRQRS
ncbi:MAG TPA: YceI family protein [Rhizomicrobium sp.]|jgi:polyisoprenoid-binding protein YceI|nr:YceI family protein [Rhizomicrobium sp.]